MDSTHLVINSVEVGGGRIFVGATDNSRWNGNLKEGMAGVNADTIVYAELEDCVPTWGSPEKLGFHCDPGDPVRPLALQSCTQLLRIAWYIRRNGLDQRTAFDQYFGVSIPNTEDANSAPESANTP